MWISSTILVAASRSITLDTRVCESEAKVRFLWALGPPALVSASTQLWDLELLLWLWCCFGASPESSQLAALLLDLWTLCIIDSEPSDGAHHSRQFDLIRLQNMSRATSDLFHKDRTKSPDPGSINLDLPGVLERPVCVPSPLNGP